MTESSPIATGALAARGLALLSGLGLAEGVLLGGLLELLDRLDLAVAVKDLSSGQYRHVTARMAALFGTSPQQLVGSTDAQWLEPAQWPPLRTAEQAAAAMPHGALTEHRLDLAGQRREFSVARVGLPSPDAGAPRLVCCLWQELTEQRARDARLQQALVQIEQQQQAAEQVRREAYDQALRDGVTGLYQPAHFEDQLRREVDLSSREHREFALVSIALDPPAEQVAALGPAAHTRILEALGRLLRGNTRAMDASCRIDDSRFAVLLSGVGLATAHSRMEGLRRQCATQIVVLDGQNIGFTVSMGVASFPHTAHSQEALLQAADAALAEARKRGGNHVTLASIRFEP